MKLLFESDLAIIDSGGLLRFVQYQPSLHPEPVVRPDCFSDRAGVSAYGTVLRDGGRLRMWYAAIPEDWSWASDCSFVAYAESDDGIHWTKPDLNVVKDAPAGNNWCDLKFHCPSVFVDPHAPPTHRYRATGHIQGNAYPQASSQWAYGAAHSPDGLRWELDRPDPQWPGGDVITTVYHPARDCGVTALKYTPRVSGIRRRSIHTAEYRNGVYGPAVTALYPDEFDDVCAAQRGFRTCDYYGMGMMPAGEGMVGFLWKFWHELPYVTYAPGNHQGFYGPSDIALVYQPDRGGKWHHIPGRPNFISHEALPWSSGWIYSSAAVVEVGDEQRLYYSGLPYTHCYHLADHWSRPVEKYVQWIKDHPVGGITFASWPRNRLFGMESPRDGWINLNLGQLSEPVELWLNYTTRYDGGIRAEIEDGDAAYALDQSVPLRQQSLNAKVAWKQGTRIVGHPGRETRIKIHLNHATIWAYDIRPA